MRLLFEIDKKDYNPNGTCFIRPSVRGIIIRDGKIAMVHSLKYNYYKFPGGGIERGEEHSTTLIREVKEGTGLTVIPDSIREYGLVHRVQKGDIEDMFVQDNYYYFCEVEDTREVQKLDDYEAFEEFTLEWVIPQHAIKVNRTCEHGSTDKVMVEREARVLEMLIQKIKYASYGFNCKSIISIIL